MPHKLFAYDPDFYSDYLDFRKDIDKIRAELNKKEVAEVKSEIKNGMQSTSQLYYVENGNAHIPIVGSLTNQLDPCASLFGVEQTLYSDIIEQTELANKDSEVEKIIYDVDSPGGAVSGVEQAAIAIRNSEKPTESHVYNMAASAAYWLVSNTDSILAADKTASVGSIGVVTELVDMSGRDKAEGVQRYTITSTDAPNKRPDISTEGGRDSIRERLDDIHNVFVETVASGRNTTAENVNDNFGKGGMLIAENALNAGMIDGIISTGQIKTKSKVPSVVIEESKTPVTAQGENKPREAKKMDKANFKAENPELYAEIKAEGKQEEQDRLAGLDAYAGINSDVNDVIAKAKAEGKTVEAVMPQILKASQTTKEAVDAQAENAAELSNVTGEKTSEEDAVNALLTRAEELR